MNKFYSHETSNPNKQILMICFFFFLSDKTVGTRRSRRFFDHLKSSGWDPFLVTAEHSQTPKNAEKQVYKTYYIDLEALAELINGVVSKLASLLKLSYQRNWVKELFLIPDEYVGWIPFCYWKCSQVIKSHKVRLIYASCSPFSALLPAFSLKKIYNIPLVVDFRDAWTLNPHNHHTFYHKLLDEMIERFILKKIDHLIVNTIGAKQAYQDKYPHIKISVIPNGLDRDEAYWKQLHNERCGSQNDRFTIYYGGTFSGKRTPELLFAALSKMIDKEKVRFICPSEGWNKKHLISLAQKFNIGPVCEFPNIQDEDLMNRELISSDLLYLKQGFEEELNTKDIAIAAKTYDYLASGTPILVECPQGDTIDLIKKYTSHAYFVLQDDIALMVNTLTEAHENWRLGKVKPTMASGAFFEAHSGEHLTAELGNVLNSILRCG